MFNAWFGNKKGSAPLNLIQAINLTNKIKQSLPHMQLLGGFAEGYALCVKADLVTCEYFNYLKLVARENKLDIFFEQGYWMLVSTKQDCPTSFISFPESHILLN
jgi:hypothetical protein